MADIKRSFFNKNRLNYSWNCFCNNYASLRCRKIIMMKKLIRNSTLVFSLLFSIAVSAQDLMIKNEAGKLYLEHKVAPKEGLFGIGRNYNVHPADLAAYNSMDINKGLNLGQIIKVPLTENNFSQTAISGTPVYYKVGVKEGLYRVGVNANVPVENIKKMNRLNSDNVSVGTKLIVGYMISGDPAQVVAKTEVKPAAPVVALKEEKKPEPKTVLVKPEPVKTVASTVSANGYFKNEYEIQIKEQPQHKDLTVTSGIFKTTSGWQNAKYYMLMDDVDPGTIIMVTNPSNGKIIYAKVLGKMNGIRQNQGLNIRISNAAASVLEISETDKFIVKANY